MEICLLLGKKFSGHDFCRRPSHQLWEFVRGKRWARLIPFPWGAWRLTGNPVVHFNLLWTATTKLNISEFHPSLAVILKKHFLLYTKHFFPSITHFSKLSWRVQVTLQRYDPTKLWVFSCLSFYLFKCERLSQETIFPFSGQCIDLHVYSGVSLQMGHLFFYGVKKKPTIINDVIDPVTVSSLYFLKKDFATTSAYITTMWVYDLALNDFFFKWLNP